MSVPPGWYPDPSGQPGGRYWDGHAWTHQVTPQDAQQGHLPAVTPGDRPVTGYALPPPAPGNVLGSITRPPMGSSFGGLGRLLVGVFIALVAVAVLTIIAIIAALMLDPTGRAFDGGRLTPATATYGLLALLALLDGALSIASVVIWLIWQHRLASSRRIDPSYLRRTPGWHIGSWFIPIANLWMPYQNVKDLARGVMSPVDDDGTGQWNDGRDRGIATRLLPWWWTAWLLSNLSASTVQRSEVVVSLDVAETVVDVVAAVLAALVVRNITRVALRPPGQPDR